jgi:galactose mutarotase-like enzyme
MYTLTSSTARATFAAHGAELTSFITLANGLEYMWQADPAVWARHAPVLFPIVGRLPDDTYLHQGQAYKLGQHGFARDREFAIVSHTDSEIVFRLVDDEASRAVYPFAFELTITYTLHESELEVRWNVRNPAATEELLFSIGAHPAFRCPLLAEEQFEDYFFAFDHFVNADRYLLQGGLLTGKTVPTLFQEKELPLSYPLFADDALVFKHYDFTRLTLRSHRSPHFVQVQFNGFPFLGLWTKGPGAEFVCIEPWQGIASSVGPVAELGEKEGMLTLTPGQEFQAAYRIAIG